MNPSFSCVLGTALLALALGCGSSGTQDPAAGSEDGSGGDAPRSSGSDPADPAGAGLDPNDPSLEVDPQICATDADCMVGTPRDCCTGFCPEHAVAWSRAAWAEYQDDCAIVECARPEQLACRPEETPSVPPSAVCVRERCVLR